MMMTIKNEEIEKDMCSVLPVHYARDSYGRTVGTGFNRWLFLVSKTHTHTHAIQTVIQLSQS